MIDKDILEDLYTKKRLSVNKIVALTGQSRFIVDKSMSYHAISRRSASDTAYLQHKKTFKIKTDHEGEDTFLYGLGLGLYWGEGNKADDYSVRLGNTDPDLINCFKIFLINICGVQPSEIKYGLQIFNDSDPLAALQFWQDHLNCGRDSFHKTVSIIPPQGKGNYRRKNEYGVVQLYVGNIKLKTWLMDELAKCAAIAQG